MHPYSSVPVIQRAWEYFCRRSWIVEIVCPSLRRLWCIRAFRKIKRSQLMGTCPSTREQRADGIFKPHREKAMAWGCLVFGICTSEYWLEYCLLTQQGPKRILVCRLEAVVAGLEWIGEHIDIDDEWSPQILDFEMVQSCIDSSTFQSCQYWDFDWDYKSKCLSTITLNHVQATCVLRWEHLFQQTVR